MAQNYDDSEYQAKLAAWKAAHPNNQTDPGF